MKIPPPPRIMMLACVLALFALSLIVWSLLDPRPIPVIVAMSVGQVLGTLSLVVFACVVVADWRAQLARAKEAAPHEESSTL